MARTGQATDPEELAAICNAVGEACSDEHGFVAVRSLLSRFKAELILRPLLVEAMIASVELHDSSARWAVLVDSERYPLDTGAIQRESLGSPLPARFRFTVAHELAHAVAFRPSEFGVELISGKGSLSSSKKFVEAVERQTDRVSSSLLLPQRTLERLLSERMSAFTAPDLRMIARNFGISRHALINRLNMLKQSRDGDFSTRNALANMAVGIGEWGTGGDAVLRRWPLFVNFADNIVPSGLARLMREDRLPASVLLADVTSVLSGGQSESIEVDTPAELPGSKPDRTLRVRCTVEQTSRNVGATFLFVISRIDTRTELTAEEIRNRWGFSNRVRRG